MKFSVALCTYNGARFLEQQLQSISAQTRLPDEVVVCDDASQDATASIIEAWAAQAPYTVRFYQNRQNLGSTKNFEQAISLCSGEIIALADQDDVWYPHKLERLESTLLAAPHAALVFSNADVVDVNLRPLGKSLWEYSGFDSVRRKSFEEGRAFDSLLQQSVVTGATLAFHARFRDLALPIPDEIISIHDGWIALTLAMVADLAFVDESLLQYRQHDAQQIGVRDPGQAFSLKDMTAPQKKRHHYAVHLRQLMAIHDLLVNRGVAWGVNDISGKAALLQGQMKHLRVRTELSTSRLHRLYPVLRELLHGKYHRYSNGFRSAVLDLYI